MTVNELTRSNSTSTGYFGKSANYHAQLTKSLFNNYHKSVQNIQNNQHNQNSQSAHPMNLNQSSGHLTMTKPSFDNDAHSNRSSSHHDHGYFTDRAAMSVPSSRIENYYNDNTIEEEIQQFIDNNIGNTNVHGDNGIGDGNSGNDNTFSSGHQNNLDYQGGFFEQRNYQHAASNLIANPQFYSTNYQPEEEKGGSRGVGVGVGEGGFFGQFPPNSHNTQSLQNQLNSLNLLNLQNQSIAPNVQDPPSQSTQSNSLNLSNPTNTSNPANQATISNTLEQPYLSGSHQPMPYYPQPMPNALPAQGVHGGSHLVPQYYERRQSYDISANPQSMFPENKVDPRKTRRARPMKKKPTFHLTLEGINKPMISHRTVSSAHSDSGADYWNRTPNSYGHGHGHGHHGHGHGHGHGHQRVPLKLAFTPALDELKQESMDFNEQSIPSFNLTPSVDPPTNERRGYFDTPKSEYLNNGSFFSPGIKSSSENVNAFDSALDDYLKNIESSMSANQTHSTQVGEGTSLSSFTPLAFDQFDSSPSEQKPYEHDNQDEHEVKPYLGNVNAFDISKYIEDEHSSPSSSSSLRPDLYRSISNHSTSSTPDEKKKRVSKGAICPVCDKYISRDLTRHMRIHNEVGRFQCVYPKQMCNHKTQNFNRPYDYKKHLLHLHFQFDDPKGKNANTLGEKLPMSGVCIACGVRFIAGDWLSEHVLTKDLEQRCLYVEGEPGDN